MELTIGVGVGKDGGRMASLGLMMVLDHRLMLLHMHAGQMNVWTESMLVGGRIRLIIDPLVGWVRIVVRLLLLLMLADLDYRCTGVWR